MEKLLENASIIVERDETRGFVLISQAWAADTTVHVEPEDVDRLADALRTKTGASSEPPRPSSAVTWWYAFDLAERDVVVPTNDEHAERLLRSIGAKIEPTCYDAHLTSWYLSGPMPSNLRDDVESLLARSRAVLAAKDGSEVATHLLLALLENDRPLDVWSEDVHEVRVNFCPEYDKLREHLAGKGLTFWLHFEGTRA